MTTRRWNGLLTALLLVCFAMPAVAQDDQDGERSVDRHVGYYYPVPQTEEIYVARATTLPESDRARRLEFVTMLAMQQMSAPYPAGLAVFAKGENAEKLIMVALRDDLFDSLYRMRGVLAMMTASARSSELFRSYKVEDIFTFFDLLKLLGFEKVTLSNGRDLSHVVYIQ
jgi:hypothetical protein